MAKAWVGAPLRAAVVVATLFGALCIRGLADMVGLPIPGLPLPAFAGSSMDNLLAIALALVAFFIARPGRGAGIARQLGLGSKGWRGPQHHRPLAPPQKSRSAPCAR